MITGEGRKLDMAGTDPTPQAWPPGELALRMLQESPDCDAWLDAQGRLVWINDAAQRLTGLSPQACLADPGFPLCLVLPADHERFHELRQRAMAEQAPQQANLRLLRHDQAISWVSVSWQPMWSNNGERSLLGTRVSMRDSVHAERHGGSQRDHLLQFRREAARITREAVARSEAFDAVCAHLTEQAARTLDISRAGVWMFDAQGEHLTCVDLFQSSSGQHARPEPIATCDFPAYMAAISTDELVVASDACTHPMTRELADVYLRPLSIASMLDAPIQQGGRTVGVLCLEQGPGLRHWSAGEVAFADALAEFIGLHREAQERQALQALTLRLASIIETTPDLVFTVTLSGEAVYLNQAGRQLMGLSPDEPLNGMNAMSFVPPELRARRVDEIIPKALKDGRWSGEVAALTRQGERIPIWEHLLTHKGPDGKVAYLSAVVRDLREQKQTEYALREREAALTRLNDELEARVAERTRKIEEINRNLETFAFSVSHDLKAPLRGIDGYSRLLMEDYRERLPEEAQGFIDNIRQAAQSMSQLIDDLLAYSRIGRRELSRSRFAMQAAIGRVLAERAHDIEGHRVKVIDHTQPLVLHTDLECFLQIMRNLIDNAVKFCRHTDTPTVTLRTEVKESRMLLCVQDNGCGFDMKYHDRIFAIFQRLHRADDYPGTGVGLAIVSKAAERMGGHVWAQGVPGEGASFYLELPLDPPSSDEMKEQTR